MFPSAERRLMLLEAKRDLRKRRLRKLEPLGILCRKSGAGTGLQAAGIPMSISAKLQPVSYSYRGRRRQLHSPPYINGYGVPADVSGCVELCTINQARQRAAARLI